MTRHFPVVVLVLFLSVLVMMQIVAGMPFRQCTPFRQYFDKNSSACKECSPCQSGYGVKYSCKSNRDTVCQQCKPGLTYSLRRRRTGSPCYACKQCSGREVIKPCTPTSDTVCGECPLGTYWDAIWSECKECSYCYSGRAESLVGPVVTSCMKKEIPSTHWCAKLRSPPYRAPLLRSKTLKNGATVFYAGSETGVSAEPQDQDKQPEKQTTTKTREINEGTTVSTTPHDHEANEDVMNDPVYVELSDVDKSRFLDTVSFDDEASGNWMSDDEDDVTNLVVMRFVKPTATSETTTFTASCSNSNYIFTISYWVLATSLLLFLVNVICFVQLRKQRKEKHPYKPIYNPHNVRNTPRNSRFDMKM
ncbi:uncharacterized protein LOC143469527 [Clavelina lepadiformis]|uniref:uncharacterized protein LOC143469527 n=1 Tax=Clavelina lepadiformis TaxID=159417 RepID=UPI004042B86D